MTNAKTSAFDLPVFGFEPQPIPSPAARTFMIPHILERSGTIANTPFTFDTQIFPTYSAGLAGIPSGSGASVDLYLFDEQGSPLRSATATDVCGPCTFQLSDAQRKASVRIDDLMLAAGGFPSEVVTGFAILVVAGDASSVSTTSMITNAKTSPLDLSVFVFEPQPLRAAANVAVGDGDVPGAVRVLSGRPNPAAGEMTFAFDLEREADVELEVYDMQGRRVASLLSERLGTGSHSLRWNRRDESGQALPAGVYFGRLQPDDGSRVTRLVFLPD